MSQLPPGGISATRQGERLVFEPPSSPMVIDDPTRPGRKVDVGTLFRNPFLKHYMELTLHAHNTDGYLKINTPALALGERINAVLTLLVSPPALVSGGEEVPPELRSVALLPTIARIMKATVYLWTEHVMGAVMSAPPHPATALHAPLFPFKTSFHTWDVSYGTGDSTWRSDWMFVDEDEAGGVIGAIHESEWLTDHGAVGKRRLVYTRSPWGTVVDESKQPGEKSLLSFAAFLRSKFVASPLTPASRPLRRAALRGGHVEPDDPMQVAVVTLRHINQQTNESTGDSREYRHQWWVSGHYRQQWHPSTQRHEVAWIAPHVKGPDGAPFLPKVYKVAR